MPSTTTYEFGDVILVPFPLSEYSALHKSRAAVVISHHDYNAEAVVLSENQYQDLIIVMGITSQEGALGAVTVKQWREAGLLYPSSIKPVIATMSQSKVIKKLGQLQMPDRNRLKMVLLKVLNLTPSSTIPARKS